MHFFTLVVLPPPNGSEPDIDGAVAAAMAPYDESLEIEQVTEDGETYWTNPQSFWDWWQIGGRWTGHLDGCNGCNGTGERTTWPTEWGPHDGDVARLGDVRERLVESPPHYLVHEGVSRAERRNPDWDGEFGAESTSPYFLATTEVTDTLAGLSDDCVVVVVDCHS